jgi:hypothetical protein
MKSLVFLLYFFIVFQSEGQDLSSAQLLDNAIAYHDPLGNWKSFNGVLHVTMVTPNKSNRESEIHINLADDYFFLKATRDSVETKYTINRGKCSTSITDIISTNNKRTPCETANLYKNYYTYLYGLPMKLKDLGTKISEVVIKKIFKGKEYLVLKVTYDEEIGTDTWYFYFDPNTYAMEVYQFFRDESKNDGEYILLTKELTINNIRMPKNRAWYYNKNDAYLGTDILKQ